MATTTKEQRQISIISKSLLKHIVSQWKVKQTCVYILLISYNVIWESWFPSDSSRSMMFSFRRPRYYCSFCWCLMDGRLNKGRTDNQKKNSLQLLYVMQVCTAVTAVTDREV
jgi:hypothetical protein